MSAAATGTALPPGVELARVLTGLQAELAQHWSTVLADERWRDVAAALERLAVPSAVATLADALGDAESDRLAGLLLQRWARIGEPSPAPAAAIIDPDPAAGPGGADLVVVVAGLEAGWTARWHGPVEPVEPSGAAVRVRRTDVAASARVGVRVFGRTTAGRTILTADAVLPAEPAGQDRHDPAGGSGAPH